MQTRSVAGRAVVAVLATVLAAAPQTMTQTPAASARTLTPTHTLAVTGTGLASYPAFTDAVRRLGVTTTPASDGVLTVEATTADPTGRVLVQGRPVTGPTTVTGLVPGQEVSVIFDDAGGPQPHTLVYLPAGFPALTVTTAAPGASSLPVSLTLTTWAGGPSYETIVNRDGVPLWVHRTEGSALDLRRQPNGHYSVARPTTAAGRTGTDLVEFDAAMQPLHTYRTVGLTNTDGHDSVITPDGHVILLAYEPDGAGHTDAIVQEQDADGDVVFTWNSHPYYAESVNLSRLPQFDPDNEDYAHVNSVVVMKDGDLLVSFRHLSAVFKIARTAHHGFDPGDVVWKLGGRDSDFGFAADPQPGGPCAQHTASELADGHILMFDNGSDTLTAKMCLDPTALLGAPIARPFTRVTEYAVRPGTHTATLMWSWVPGRFGFFAGSAQRLAGGTTLVGWAAVPAALATEVDPAGHVVWELRDPAADVAGGSFFSTYRALAAAYPDVVDPTAILDLPETVELGQVVTPDYSCTDEGGSDLVACTPSAAVVDTSTVGTHDFTVAARDGAGTTVTASRSYRVLAPYAVDASLARHGTVGDRLVVRIPKGATRTVALRLRNAGERPDQFVVTGAGSSKRFAVRYVSGGADVTQEVLAGTWTSSVLDGDAVGTVKVRVTRLAKAHPGDRLDLVLHATSVTAPTAEDLVVLRART